MATLQKEKNNTSKTRAGQEQERVEHERSKEKTFRKVAKFAHTVVDYIDVVDVANTPLYE